MTILSDRWIRRMAQDKGMIEPFVDAQKRAGVISYGLSSYGYDARVGPDFKIFTNVNSSVVDPKNFDEQSFVDRTNGFFARDKERDNHEGINHDVAQRKQRQLFGDL